MPFDRQACPGVPLPLRGRLARSRPHSAKLIERSVPASVDQQRDDLPGGQIRPLQPCAICRVEPLIFQECPACSARYCAGGCLHSWYEHNKRERTNREQNTAVPVEVQSSEADYITVEFPEGEVVELGLSRFAGGMVVAEDSSRRKSASDQRPRWNITSVDGWIVGQPGPGAEWTPAQGVTITLEELGSCAKCHTPQALPEYICNSAGRDGLRSNSRSRLLSQGGAAVQKPRIRTAEVEIQTRVETADAEIQTELETADAGIQGLSESEVVAQAQVAIAGFEIAALAMPRAGNADAQELTLTADRASAKQHIHSALCAVARLVAPAQDTVRGSHAALVDAACDAVGSLERSAGASKQQEIVDDRTRILSSAACLPKTEEVETAGHEACLDLPVETRAALASAALKTLGEIREAQSAETASLPPRLTGAEKDKHDEAERQLLSWRNLASRTDLDRHARLHEVLANVAASLCGCPNPGGNLMEVLDAVHAVSRLVPIHESVPWRRLACAEVWPWLQSPSSDPIKSPRGWPTLRTALAALIRLGGMPLSDVAQSEIGAALRSLANLELFVDAEAEREDFARAAEQARLEEERAKAEEERAKVDEERIKAEEAPRQADAKSAEATEDARVAGEEARLADKTSSVFQDNPINTGGAAAAPNAPTNAASTGAAASSADSKETMLDAYLSGGGASKPDLGLDTAPTSAPHPKDVKAGMANLFGKPKGRRK